MASMSPEDEEVTILEEREASPSHFLLKIESFSLLGKSGIHRYESREFYAGGQKWRLILYPNEDNTGKDKDYISLHLAISDTTSLTSEINAFFSIFVFNHTLTNYHYSPGRTRRFMAVKSEWGISRFISKKVLNDPSNGFILDDKCVFGAEVFIVGLDQDKLGWHYWRPKLCERRLDYRWMLTSCFTISHAKHHHNNDQHEYYNERVMQEPTILETREAPPTHFLMKIIGKPNIFNCQKGEFDAGGYKWRLRICCNEDKSGIESKYISVYLSMKTNWNVNVVFSIFLFNQISLKYLHSLGRTRRFLAVKPEWGISDFISKKALMDPSNGFLINNSCVFGAEVFIIEKSTVYECLSVKNATISYKENFKISDFSGLGDHWTSRTFVAGSLNWKISVRPKGHNHEKAIGIFLALVDPKRVKAKFSICIKDQINNKHKEKTSVSESNWFSHNWPEWGWTQFMELSTLQDPVNGFIVQDCCHLQIKLWIEAVV